MTDRHLERLVRKAARGDERAFGRLYDAFADRVFGYVRLRVRDERDVEELVETVFLRVFEALPGYEHRGLPFSAWLFRIARNAVVDHVRRLGRMPVVTEEPDAELVADGAGVEQVVFARLDGDRVREAMTLLTEEQATVLTMRFWWGLDVRSCAQALDRTDGAVKALQHRAIRSLAKLLAEEAEDATA